MNLFIVLVLCSVIIISEGQRRLKPKKLPTAAADTETSIVSKLLHYYNKNEPPMKDRPTEVRLGIYVNNIYEISDQSMDFSLSMYLRQAWRDPRLEFGNFSSFKSIRLSDGMATQIWKPDTFFRNEKNAAFHHVTVANRLTKINATGHVWHVTKISARFSCPMSLQKYPMDTQMCPILFESFGYTMDTLYYTWLGSPVDVDSGVQLPQFTLKDIILYDCSQNYTAGAFPCLEIRFVLQRDFGYFMLQLYVPSVLVVALSWIAFWIGTDAVQARVILGILTILIMTTLGSGIVSSLPRVSYVKAIDIWLMVCYIFVFGSLLELIVVSALSRKQGPKKGKQPIGLDSSAENKQIPSFDDDDENDDGSEWKKTANRVDVISRVAYPLLFVFFVIFYWALYTGGN